MTIHFSNIQKQRKKLTLVMSVNCTIITNIEAISNTVPISAVVNPSPS